MKKGHPDHTKETQGLLVSDGRCMSIKCGLGVLLWKLVFA